TRPPPAVPSARAAARNTPSKWERPHIDAGAAREPPRHSRDGGRRKADAISAPSSCPRSCKTRSRESTPADCIGSHHHCIGFTPIVACLGHVRDRSVSWGQKPQSSHHIRSCGTSHASANVLLHPRKKRS